MLSDTLDLSDLTLPVSALVGAAMADSGFEGLSLTGPGSLGLGSVDLGSVGLGSVEPGFETSVDSASNIL